MLPSVAQLDCGDACQEVSIDVVTEELTELLIRLSGKTAEIEYMPAGLTFVTNRIGSIEAAEKDLGFKWSIDLEDGMQRLINWRRGYIAELEARRNK